MRARNIKPGFFINEDLAEVDVVGRLLFIGLWCLADREGRLEDRPKRIKGELFRFDDISVQQVDVLLEKLASLNMVRRYEVEGNKYLEIINFSKHQKPHYAEKPSIIPEECNENTPINPDECTKNTPIEGGVEPPDSLIPDSLKKTPPTPPPGGNGCDADFFEWWGELPPQMRKDQVKALQVWRRLKNRGKLPDLPAMLKTLRAQKRSEAWQREEGRYIPLPHSYLRKGRFHDESVGIGEEPRVCHACKGSGLRKAKPGEDGIDGQVRCECKSAKEARGP